MKIAGVSAAGAAASGALSACTPSNEKIRYGSADTPVMFECDVCVVGGGPSGVAAAVSAGKMGASAAIIERGITLGGLQTLGNVIPCMTT